MLISQKVAKFVLNFLIFTNNLHIENSWSCGKSMFCLIFFSFILYKNRLFSWLVCNSSSQYQYSREYLFNFWSLIKLMLEYQKVDEFGLNCLIFMNNFYIENSCLMKLSKHTIFSVYGLWSFLLLINCRK